MRAHVIRLGALAIAIAASAASCGDDETGSGSSGSGATTSATSAGPGGGQGGSSASAGGGTAGSGASTVASGGGTGPTSTSSGGGTCPPDAGDTACMSCLKMNCCDQLNTCGDDAACKCWVDCMNTINNYSKCFKAPGNCGPFSPMAQALVQCDQGPCGASCQM